MKFIKFFLLLPVIAFTFEVEFDKTFSKKLSHDTLSAFLFVTITDNNEITLNDRLEVFNQKIKSFDKVERKLVSYKIKPVYKHSANTPSINGYLGELKYKVNSRKARYLDEFIFEITSLKKNRDTTVSINDLFWSVKKEVFEKTLDLLRLEAINWGLLYIKDLSQNTSRDCKLKNIHIDMDDFTTKDLLLKPLDEAESQFANQDHLIIKAKYSLECE